MDYIFECPHCGVTSRIPSEYLGETGPCRACGAEVTVPFPEKVAAPRKLGRVDGENERARQDEFEVIDFRRMRESAPERESRGPSRMAGFGMLAVLLITSGRALFGVLGFNEPRRPAPIKNDPMLKARLEAIDRALNSQKKPPAGRLSDQEQDAIIKGLRRGTVRTYPPEQTPSPAPPNGE